MKKMQSVMTVRLPEEDIKIVESLSSEEKIDKSKLLRELIESGRKYFAITKYAEGEISIGRAAEISGMLISELIDLLAKFRIESKLDMNDYLEGDVTLRKFS